IVPNSVIFSAIARIGERKVLLEGSWSSTMLAKRLKRCSILLFAFLLADASGSLLESSGGQAEAIGPQISPATEGEGKRRSLATGMFCVALPNADPTALQEGLNWACGQGHANCAAIQPGGPCYKANNLPALASYAYNDYYQRNSGAGATCSFNGTATTTATDPSSGQCVFSGSSMAGGTTPAANAPSAVGPFTPGFGNGSSPTFPGTGSPGGALTPFDAADSVMSGARRALCALLLASPIFLSLVL
ncbi:Os07g0633100, partial [Oryza sativa Japonica Group]